MYRELKKIEFPNRLICTNLEKQDQKADHEIDGKMKWGRMENSWWRRVAGKSVWQGGMEEAPGNGKESSHCAHVNGTERNRMGYTSFTLATHKIYLLVTDKSVHYFLVFIKGTD
jgi:hypothetical protein